MNSLSPMLPSSWPEALRQGQGVIAELQWRLPGLSPQMIAGAALKQRKDKTFIFLESPQRLGERERLTLWAGEPLFSFIARGRRGAIYCGRHGHDLNEAPEEIFGALGEGLRACDIAEGEKGIFPFLGWLSYEAGSRYERLPLGKPDPLGLPDWFFFLPGRWAWYDPEKDLWRFRCLLAEQLFQIRLESRLGRSVDQHPPYYLESSEARLKAWIADTERLVEEAQEEAREGGSLDFPRRLNIRDNATPDSYCDMVRKAKQYIAAGDVFQVNLSHRLSAEYRGSAWPLYRRLSQINPSPQACFADLGPYQIASASPERLFSMAKEIVQTEPIAGTLAREAGESGPKASDLLLSEKDRAEHIMTVDIERNDLARICEAGSVQVRDLMALESYSHVHHLVSRIQGHLKDGFDLPELFRAGFPGGSITGAPKIRCMEIIAELEGERRGLYTGSLGYWDPIHRQADFNILIRSIFLSQGQAYWQVGAGIVADSDPEREWKETLLKAAALKLALESAPA